jgi:hypothetical protein
MERPCSRSSSSVRRARLKGVMGMTASEDRCWPMNAPVNSAGLIKQLTFVTGPLCCVNLRSDCRLDTSQTIQSPSCEPETSSEPSNERLNELIVSLKG